ncbi:hypothetical protein [Marinobacter sp. F3R08]|uniref:hypothetical protein n=1 Tax=Marinobacter sp. F3R08 TaxID=2841559 RepID=UPI001C097339|nr:hypothetical protein [Marinobacter sp. F3R08]MBU2955524.1 hypothetical protein [Marinobacter sp. F3R08]
MTAMILVNLPATNLDISTAFYQALDFHNNPQLTDITAGMVRSDNHRRGNLRIKF